jgi:hypothetical protein
VRQKLLAGRIEEDQAPYLKVGLSKDTKEGSVLNDTVGQEARRIPVDQNCAIQGVDAVQIMPIL